MLWCRRRSGSQTEAQTRFLPISFCPMNNTFFCRLIERGNCGAQSDLGIFGLTGLQAIQKFLLTSLQKRLYTLIHQLLARAAAHSTLCWLLIRHILFSNFKVACCGQKTGGILALILRMSMRTKMNFPVSNLALILKRIHRFQPHLSSRLSFWKKLNLLSTCICCRNSTEFAGRSSRWKLFRHCAHRRCH